jgi:chemotaxis protein MotB
MFKRESLEEPENQDRWLISYADFITLLFAFFVVMYSVSSVNQHKYQQFSNSIDVAFNGTHLARKEANLNEKRMNAEGYIKQKNMIKSLPLSHLYNEKFQRDRENMTRTGIALSNKLSGLISEGKLRVLQTNRGIRIDINDGLLFKTASTELTTSANEIMQDIATVIKSNQRLVQVEGHTDNIAIHNNLYFSNWELSALRASRIVRVLSEEKIADNRLSATAFGATQPISDNETENGRARNRRVSIMILYETKNDVEAALEIMPQIRTSSDTQ